MVKQVVLRILQADRQGQFWRKMIAPRDAVDPIDSDLIVGFITPVASGIVSSILAARLTIRKQVAVFLEVFSSMRCVLVAFLVRNVKKAAIELHQVCSCAWR